MALHFLTLLPQILREPELNENDERMNSAGKDSW